MLKNWFNRSSHRTEALASIAKELGLSFTPKDEFGVINHPTHKLSKHQKKLIT